MRTDLCDIEGWPSPSPEAVVRARVLGRARAIARRRALAAFAALTVAVVFGAYPRGIEGSSRVETVDTPTVGVQRAVGDGDPADTAGATDATVATVQSTLAESFTTGETPASTPGSEGRASPATANPGPTTLSDPAGDAFYRDCPEESCVSDGHLDDGSRSQPALDILSVDLRCAPSGLVVELRVLDLDAPLDPNRVGMPANKASYIVSLWFDTRQFSVDVSRVVPDGSWTSSIGTVDRVGSSIVVAIPFEDIGGRPQATETAEVFGVTAAFFSAWVGGPNYADRFGEQGGTEYRVCG